MFVEVLNDDFDKDLKRKGKQNSADNIPHQQLPLEMVYYFSVSSTLQDAGFPGLGIGGMGAMPTTTTTYFSTSEMLLLQHRNSELERILAGRPEGSFVDRVDINTIRWRWGMGFSMTFSITDIRARTRPDFVSPTSGVDRVDNINRAF